MKVTKKVKHVKAISLDHRPMGGGLSIPHLRNAKIAHGHWTHFFGQLAGGGSPFVQVFGCLWLAYLLLCENGTSLKGVNKKGECEGNISSDKCWPHSELLRIFAQGKGWNRLGFSLALSRYILLN